MFDVVNRVRRLDYASLASLRQTLTLRSIDGNTLTQMEVSGATTFFALKECAASALALSAADKDVDEMSEAEAKRLLKQLMRKRAREEGSDSSSAEPRSSGSSASGDGDGAPGDSSSVKKASRSSRLN